MISKKIIDKSVRDLRTFSATNLFLLQQFYNADTITDLAKKILKDRIITSANLPSGIDDDMAGFTEAQVKERLGVDTLVDADLSAANLAGADLRGVNMAGADLTNANLSGANLSGADLHKADLSAADLSNADLSNSNLDGATMYAVLLTGADASFANLNGAQIEDSNIINVNLTNANLRGANLHHSDLIDSVLNNADLRGADLRYTSLMRTDFINANLDGANLTTALLDNTDFTDASLIDVNFNHVTANNQTILKNAKINKATIDSTPKSLAGSSLRRYMLFYGGLQATQEYIGAGKKEADPKKLEIFYRNLCNDLNDNYNLAALHGMAKAQGIPYDKRTKEDICADLAVQFVVAQKTARRLPYTTRSYDDEIIQKNIRRYLSMIEHTKGKQNKIPIIIKMMDYIVSVKKIVNDNQSLKNIIQAKFIELAKKGLVLDKQYKAIFGEELVY